MQPNKESDELSEMLKVGYAAPPLDDAFSSNLVRQLQAEIAPQTRQPRSRPAGWAVVMSCMGIAATILAVIYVLYPLGTKPSRDEVAMLSIPSSNEELITSFKSKLTRSLETDSMPTNAVELRESITIDVPPAKSRGGEAARETRRLESAIELDAPRGIVQHDSKVNESLRGLSELESMSAWMMEEIEVVTKERAKALGLSITSQADGPAVLVSLEFETQGELKGYSHLELKQFSGDTQLLTATLKERQTAPGRVVVGFVAARSNLATLFLKIAAKDPSGSRVGYVLPMKDFVER